MRAKNLRVTLLIAAMFLLAGSVREAAALCRNNSSTATGPNTVTVAAGDGTSLYNYMFYSTAPCTITVPAGTYQAPVEQFQMPAGITVVSSSGAATTTLRSLNFTAVAIWPLAGSCPSGASLEGFTLEGPAGGVFVGSNLTAHLGCTATANSTTGITLRRLIVNEATTPLSGSGVTFSKVQNSLIDSVTIKKAASNGIVVGAGSANNSLTNNIINGNIGANGILVDVSDNNLITNNTLAATTISQNGIWLNTNSNNVVGTNTIDGTISLNGILVSAGGGHLIMNNSITGSLTQQAIAVQSSNDNVIVRNTINVSRAFDGIFLNSSTGSLGPGNLRNRIERNTIAGHSIDGILLNDVSLGNYVGLNIAVSSAFSGAPGSTPSRPSGVGLWVNNGSNGNYLFGNDVSGSPENGIDVLTSKSTLLVGNRVHGNYQGGIWVANVNFEAHPSAPAPRDTVLQGNYSYFNTQNGQLFFQGATNTQASFNYLSGASSPNGTLAANTTAAVTVYDSVNFSVFENTVSEVGARTYIPAPNTGAATTGVFFRNRFLRGTNIPQPTQTDGLNGVTYAIPPASITWDAGSFLGGNHWSDHTAAIANPDPAHPYIGFIGNPPFPNNGGPNIDRFPFRAQTLQLGPVPNSVTVYEPVINSVLAAGERKTVRWVGRGCTLVDVYYVFGGTATLIASGQPNIGYFFWTVPSVPFGSYSVRVVCADPNGVPLGVSGNGPAFTIASSNLVLMTPGRAFRATNAGTVRVGWKKAASVSAVNVFVRSGIGAEVPVLSGVTGTVYDIALPPQVSTSGQVTLRIENAANSQDQDSVDGYFMVRGPIAAFTTNLTGQTLQIGSVLPLEWVGRSDSYFVDLSLFTNGALATTIATNLADFGTFTWLVPDFPTSNAFIRATFKDSAGTTLASLDSATFALSRNQSAPTVNAAIRKDFDGDSKSDLVVFRSSNGTWYVNYSAGGYNAATFQSFQWGLPGDLPLSADFDGDGKVELTVYRPSNGTWYVRHSSQSYNVATAAAYQWGLPQDVPILGDFDADGKTDLTVYRPSTGEWFIRYSAQSFNAATYGYYQWGLSGDEPLSSDFDGDGQTDVAVYRPTTGVWYIRLSSQGYSGLTAASFQWGLSGDTPIVGDFDGDGRSELTVFRPSNGTWYVRYSAQAFNSATADAFQWGLPGDVPLVRDFDGDGKTELTVFRPSNGTWYVRFSSQAFSVATYQAFQWGLPGDSQIK